MIAEQGRFVLCGCGVLRLFMRQDMHTWWEFAQATVLLIIRTHTYTFHSVTMVIEGRFKLKVARGQKDTLTLFNI